MTSTASLGERTSESIEARAQPLVHGDDITPMRTSVMTLAQTQPQLVRHPPIHLQDFIHNVLYATGPHLSSLHETTSSISHHISHFINYDKSPFLTEHF